MTNANANKGRAFKDIGDIYFDREFTLDPYPFLEEVYANPKLKGFHSCGMDFIIRHTDATALLMEHAKVAREPIMSEEMIAHETRMADKYPHRAFIFKYGLVDLKAKGLLVRYINLMIEQLDLNQIKPVFAKLQESGLHENYLDDIKTLPMRIFLTAWGLTFDEEQLLNLYESGTSFVKSFDNYQDEEMTAMGNAAEAFVYEYSEQQLNEPAKGSLFESYLNESRDKGIDDRDTIGSVMTVINAVGNTLAVSTGYLLRNLIRFPEITQSLRDNPDLLDQDTTVMEFLRRDNHVKSLSRQVHETFSLNGLEMKPGQSVYLFYPGINLDPNHWDDPLQIDFSRDLSRERHVIFGGSRYTCIGARLSMVYIKYVLKGIVEKLPRNIEILTDQEEIDDGWIAERVLKKLPIVIG